MLVFLTQNKSTFSIQSFYHPKINEIFNSIQGKQFDCNLDIFTFPISERDHLIDRLIDINVSIKQVESFPPRIIVPKIAKMKVAGENIDVLTPYHPQVNRINIK